MNDTDVVNEIVTSSGSVDVLSGAVILFVFFIVGAGESIVNGLMLWIS
jgi:hypothetical protein